MTKTNPARRGSVLLLHASLHLLATVVVAFLYGIAIADMHIIQTFLTVPVLFHLLFSSPWEWWRARQGDTRREAMRSGATKDDDEVRLGREAYLQQQTQWIFRLLEKRHVAAFERQHHGHDAFGDAVRQTGVLAGQVFLN